MATETTSLTEPVTSENAIVPSKKIPISLKSSLSKRKILLKPNIPTLLKRKISLKPNRFLLSLKSNLRISLKSDKYNIPRLEGEYFIPVNNYPNYYISDLARLWSMKLKRFSTGSTDARCGGYIKIKLTENGITKSFLLHRLVAIHFIPNPENKPEVNHLGDKVDNRACMLEWATRKENCEHSGKNKIKFRQVSVQQIDPETKQIIKTYQRMTDTKQDGFHPGKVYNAIKKKNGYGGFEWKYTEEKEEEVVIDGEQWYDLKDSIYNEVNCFPKYKVSDHGRIRGWYGRLLKPNYSNGIGNIKLANESDVVMIKVHRLVLMACNIPNPENKPEVDHIDSDCCNNKLSNLKWATKTEQGENEETRKKLSKPQYKRRKKVKVTELETGTEYIHEGLNDLAKKLGIDSQTISRYAKSKEAYKGHKFEFVE